VEAQQSKEDEIVVCVDGQQAKEHYACSWWQTRLMDMIGEGKDEATAGLIDFARKFKKITNEATAVSGPSLQG
jgi:hypothetical protein